MYRTHGKRHTGRDQGQGSVKIFHINFIHDTLLMPNSTQVRFAAMSNHLTQIIELLIRSLYNSMNRV